MYKLLGACWLGVIVLLAAVRMADARDREGVTAFVDITVVSMTGEPSKAHQTVVVAGNKIQSLGAAGNTRVPRKAFVIDGRNKYLIPGLIDSHVHLWGYSRETEGNADVERAVLNLLLANGVTTAIVMEGSPASLAVREKVAKGVYVGPRIYTAGPILQATGTGAPAGRQTFTTPDEIIAEIIRERAAGFDFVKVHGAMPAETYRALLDTAQQVGLPVIGHVPDNLGIEAALAGGQRQITHVESYLQTYFEFHRSLPTDPAESANMIQVISTRTKQAGAFVAPTLSVFHQIISQIADPNALLSRPAMNYLPAAALKDWRSPNNPYLARFTLADIPGLLRQYAVMSSTVVGLERAGVPLLVGTDDLVPCQLPGISVKDEFELLAGAGLTPLEVLTAATVNGARFLDKPEVSGTVETGKVADLVMLDANPLDDVDNVFRQAGVMLRGVWYPESILQARLLNAGKTPRSN